jgi:hypothetical protein
MSVTRALRKPSRSKTRRAASTSVVRVRAPRAVSDSAWWGAAAVAVGLAYMERHHSLVEVDVNFRMCCMYQERREALEAAGLRE